MRVANSLVNQSVRSNELPTLNAPAVSRVTSVSGGVTQKASYSTDDAAKQILRGGYRHYDRNGDGKIELSFTLGEQFSTQQKVSIRQALQAWQDVANIVFKEGSTDSDGSITINADPNTSGGRAQLPNGYYGDVAATIGTQGAAESPNNGDYFLLAAIHEVGHALGLGHPGDYGKTVLSYADAVYKQDTRAHNVMSYWDANNQPEHDFKHLQPSVPLKDDIAAIQKLYGANPDTRNTDTVYGFNSTTGRDHLSLKSANDTAIFSVWDGGGNDTLDFSGFSQDQIINLHAESYSSVGGLKGNVSIAKGVVLENAIGGSGDDDIYGNDVGNRLRGGGGADRLIGGGGADVFVYDRASDSTLSRPDEILDFTSGTDKIDLCGLLKNAPTKHFNVVKQFTGRPGEIVLSHDPRSGNASLSLDLTGQGKADFFIKSVGRIQASDIVTGGEPAPGATTLKPTPKPGLNPDDTVYGFNANTGDSSTSLHAGSGAPSFLVEDTGGNDTLDFSGFKQDQRIDLRHNASSSVGGLRNNVAIAKGVMVENAVGGSGRDRIVGNAVSNVITGGGGGDELWGVGGKNTFKYDKVTDSSGYDPDRIMDFASGEDTIDLTALAAELGTPLRLVDAYTGRIGDTVVKHDRHSGRSIVGIDLLGRRQSDFLIKSARLIRPQDVLGLTSRQR
ncbi:M10 family metallopeptidase C-terminal domain-containing protein [Pseudomonas sp. O64]|uniref:M10 family metallopeptidase C-terminal domain-containing protein n=2 Tax=Pseudomonas TaxID=286 RepID=UPI001F5995FB|nr:MULTISPECIES: M10 family metallopeptidase C-terminal domain-containing protein [unclassified Pseudomonas]UNM21875.1 M10 family metallopeptidase C-terminal domain-containing protein [Pseudomonas sp. ArH3a]UXZ24580.1 M10 family metallopeptidase C-terminal domain-containing protein [Pseudomonas sp. YeP6b]